jgi:hypothetical protein
MRHTLSELTGLVYGHETVRENDHDLTIQHEGEPLDHRPQPTCWTRTAAACRMP